MRGLWRTIANIAQNQNGFNAKLDAAAGYDTTNNLMDNIKVSSDVNDTRVLNLNKQPTVAVLQALDSILRTERGLVLTAYELAEVNRITYETKGDAHKTLTGFWAALHGIGDKYSNDPNFMEALGALAIDGQLRYDFAQNNLSLTPWFHVQDQQQSDLRPQLKATTPADNSAKAYLALSWPGGACASIVTAWPAWVHFNA